MTSNMIQYEQLKKEQVFSTHTINGGTCSLMKQLNYKFDNLGHKYGIKVKYEDIEPFRSMICGYVCNGTCKDKYIK